MKKVSVAIPVYNGENYLREAIESVLSQEYPNIELIVCNGESTDGTQAICDEYSDKIICIQGEKGLQGNWEAALNACTGDYIKILCHDDVLTPDCILQQVFELEANKNVILVSCDRQYIDGNGDHQGGTQWAGWKRKEKGSVITDELMQHGNVVGETSCVLFRNVGVKIDTNMNWLLDMALWVELFKQGDYLYIPEPLCKIRKHEAQDTHRVLKDPDYNTKEIADKRRLWRKVKDFTVAYFLRDDGACGHYRVDLPLSVMGNRSNAQVYKITSTMPEDDVEAAINLADVVVMPRPGGLIDLENCARLKDMGKKLVIDHDDNVFEVSPLSIHYGDHGVEDVLYDFGDGEPLPLWKDGVNLNIEENRTRHKCFKMAMEMADMVTVTTSHLANTYREFNRNVVVLPNCVDLKVWQASNIKKDDTIKLYWSGGASHYQDVWLLKDVIPAIMAKYPQTKLVVMGSLFPFLTANLPKDRVEYHQWVPTPAYPYKTILMNCDISMIPLEDNKFNRCKSPIKWVEQSSLGIPSVMSNVKPYSPCYNGQNAVMVNNDTASWVKGISALIEDSILRAKIGGEARKYVETNFDINSAWRKWYEAYKGLLDESVFDNIKPGQAA